jgi:uncharacterized linocin/CFP29 family protein
VPGDVRGYPHAIAQALSLLRQAGFNRPYSVVLGAKAYTKLAAYLLQWLSDFTTY